MKVSIIICFYNRLDMLPVCLDSLRWSLADIHEVIIADDGSSKEVVENVQVLIKKYDFPIIHAWHQRLGARRSATRNNGIRHASGDYLIFLDADFAILPGAIRSHIEAAKQGCFAAGRCKYTTKEQCQRIIAEGASIELLEAVYASLPDRPIEKEHSRFVRHALLYRFHLASPKKISFGGHFSAFKKDVEAINGYDENFVGWGGEDTDFAMRMVRAGFRGISVIRSARVLHLWHPTEMPGAHWREGENVEYYLQSKPVSCENGLIRKIDNIQIQNLKCMR